jgi:hypothetical protein
MTGALLIGRPPSFSRDCVDELIIVRWRAKRHNWLLPGCWSNNIWHVSFRYSVKRIDDNYFSCIIFSFSFERRKSALIFIVKTVARCVQNVAARNWNAANDVLFVYIRLYRFLQS